MDKNQIVFGKEINTSEVVTNGVDAISNPSGRESVKSKRRGRFEVEILIPGTIISWGLHEEIFCKSSENLKEG